MSFVVSILCCIAILLNIVPIECQISPSSPAISGYNTYSVGDNGSFTCSSSGGLPDPSVKWFRNGQLVDDSYALTSGQANTGGTVSNTVSLTVTASDHYAVYECQVDNGVTQDPLKSNRTLLVRSTPKTPTLVGPTYPPPGQQNTWTCTSVGSFPQATMTMRRGNQQFSNEFTHYEQKDAATKTWNISGTLSWTPMTTNNGDILYCDVAHENLAIQQTVDLKLTVLDPLVVNAPITQYTPTIGMSFILHCIVTSGTATSVVWLKDNALLIINLNPRLSNGNVQTPSLTITNVQQSDQGNYVCRAANAKTTVNTSTIIVTPLELLAINAPVTSYTPTIGTTVTLNCVVTSGTATSIIWLKYNNVLNINTNSRYSNGNVQTPPLTITDVQHSDQGNYVCRAANAQTTVNTNTIAVTSKDRTRSTDSSITALPEDTCTLVKNVLVGIVVVLVIIQVAHILFDYWMYRKGYLRCDRKKIYEDTNRYIDQHRYSEIQNRESNDNTSHIYNIVLTQ